MRYVIILIFTILTICNSARAAYTITQLSGPSNSGPFTALGQSWTATGGDGVLSSISVNSVGASTGTLNLYVYNGESANPGNQIYTQAISSFSGAGVQTINLTGTVNITNGNQYTFVIQSTGGNVRLRYDITNPYAGGKSYASGTGFVSSSDFYFSISISDSAPAPTGVPTLSEWGMIIFTMLIMFYGIKMLRKRDMAV